jgi:gluconokinase
VERGSELSDSGTVSSDAARDPLVMAIDVGTSSARAFVYDVGGDMVDGWGARRRYDVHTTKDGGVEIDADALVQLVTECIDETASAMGEGAHRIVGVGCDTFWHSLMGVAPDNRPATPVYTWADTRSSSAADALRRQLDAAEVHQRTGAVLHSSYPPAKLKWLQTTQPELFQSVQYWMSFGEYLYLCMFGERRASVSMASATGMFDQRTCTWYRPVLEAVSVEESKLSPIVEFTQSFKGLKPPFAGRWPWLNEVPWYLAVGDGAANNIGSGGSGPEWWVIMVGTSGAMRVVRQTDAITVPDGLWSYRVDRHRIIQGGALSSGGNIFAWLSHSLQVPTVAQLELQLSQMEPDSHGLTVLPFLAGERSPTWDSSARGVMVGLTLATRPIDIVRASLEAIAYRFALIEVLLRSDEPVPRGIIGSGSGLLDSPAWMQIMTDVLAQPLVTSAVPEASSRGAALLALEAAGAIPHAADVRAPLGTKYAPVEAHTGVYRRAMKRQTELYAKLVQ